MESRITEEDITVHVRGAVYKIPWYVLADDRDMRKVYGLYESELAANQLRDSLLQSPKEINVVPLRAVIALKQEEYAAYRFVSLSATNERKLCIDIVAKDDVFQLCFQALKDGLARQNATWPEEITVESFTEKYTEVNLSTIEEAEEEAYNLIAGLMGLTLAVMTREYENYKKD